MSKKTPPKNNLKLAGIFIAAVLGLIFLSFVVKLLLVVGDSKFDGKHKFNVLLSGDKHAYIISLSPDTRSISTIKISNIQNVSRMLEVPIDGYIIKKGEVKINNLSATFINAEFPFGGKVNNLTFLDLIRLALFSRTISLNSFYQREITNDLTSAQINTIISLTFTDPSIYEENQSIEIINATNVNGLGARLASFITNIGGNPILVSNNEKVEQKSRIIYYDKESFTVKKLSSYLKINKEKQLLKNKGISDVIIIIGNDLVKSNKF